MESGCKLFRGSVRVLLRGFARFSIPGERVVLRRKRASRCVCFIRGKVMGDAVLERNERFVVFFTLRGSIPLDSPGLARDERSLCALRTMSAYVL